MSPRRCESIAANGYSRCAREEGHEGDHEVNEAPGRHAKWPQDDDLIYTVREAVEWIVSVPRAWEETDEALAERITNSLMADLGGKDLGTEDLLIRAIQGIGEGSMKPGPDATLTFREVAERVYAQMPEDEKRVLIRDAAVLPLVRMFRGEALAKGWAGSAPLPDAQHRTGQLESRPNPDEDRREKNGEQP